LVLESIPKVISFPSNAVIVNDVSDTVLTVPLVCMFLAWAAIETGSAKETINERASTSQRVIVTFLSNLQSRGPMLLPPACSRQSDHQGGIPRSAAATP
jgi:hypothetical protein